RGKVQEMPVFIGAPGGIRTPDPQPSNLEVGVRISRGAPFRDTLSAPNATALALDSSHFRSPAASAAAAHVAMPCAINCANSSGEPSSGSKPDPASLPTTSSDLSAAWAAAESFSITARGVPAGAIRPNQTVQSKLGSNASAMVGMFGAMRGRLAEPEA